jgi:hypothetical protein
MGELAPISAIGGADRQGESDQKVTGPDDSTRAA